jgi:uncharacterized lipoprotein YmbA
MIVAITENQYRISEEHRWAESLEQNIFLALIKALPGQLGTDRIIRYPWPQRQLVDYQVGIDKRSIYQFPASTADYELMVKAQSLCLTRLSEIAETLRKN